MKRQIVAGLLIALATPSMAQSPVATVERSVKALPNKDTQIGLYLNVRQDCTSGPLPTIRLISPPKSGKGGGQNRKGESHQLQGMLGARSAGLYRFL
jgi:hypothetical protein